MRNNPFRQISILFVFVLAAISVTGCGGGISGTGGGSIITTDATIETDMADTGSITADSNGSVSDNNAPVDSGSPTADSVPVSINNVIPDLSGLIANLIQSGNGADTNSVTRELAQNLIAIASQLQNLQSALQNQQNLPVSTTAGSIFDNTAVFSQAGSNSTIQWTNDNALVSIVSTTDENTLYLLQENQRLTLRNLDRSQNTLFQASVVPTSNIVATNPAVATSAAVVVEAVSNNNGALIYTRALSSEDNTITFSEHPTDNTVQSQREILAANGTTIALETCTQATAINNCQTDTDWSAVSTNATAANTFAVALENIEQSLADVVSALDTLPGGTSSAVIANTENVMAIDPNLQCGLQVVRGVVRSFCIQPLPLDPIGNVFEEIFSGGEIFYQRLP